MPAQDRSRARGSTGGAASSRRAARGCRRACGAEVFLGKRVVGGAGECLRGVRGGVLGQGATPARAGSTGVPHVLRYQGRDHPRTRGEHVREVNRVRMAAGPPPHARGAPFVTCGSIKRRGCFCLLPENGACGFFSFKGGIFKGAVRQTPFCLPMDPPGPRFAHRVVPYSGRGQGCWGHLFRCPGSTAPPSARSEGGRRSVALPAGAGRRAVALSGSCRFGSSGDDLGAGARPDFKASTSATRQPRACR